MGECALSQGRFMARGRVMLLLGPTALREGQNSPFPPARTLTFKTITFAPRSTNLFIRGTINNGTVHRLARPSTRHLKTKRLFFSIPSPTPQLQADGYKTREQPLSRTYTMPTFNRCASLRKRQKPPRETHLDLHFLQHSHYYLYFHPSL